MDQKQKIDQLQDQLKKLKERLQHMATEYSATKEGSSYGVEYYEIQCRVYQSMISDLQSEIDKLKRKKD
ncbi:MAG: hypothetical protein WC596_02720 [Candidatus Shapirobacteria bacterium]